ncbi:MAG: 1-deoxy-D-xylulose-5-phosphate reductoisomerase [Phycisphaerales bacterium]|nr:1-deoxy-D-xylulose-5-phosphate reductoisomerase [Phycisphaerales bacterium]
MILGSTGSIGTQTIEVVEHLARLGGEDGFEVVGLAAGSNADALFAQARRLGVRDLALGSPGKALASPDGAAKLRVGPDAAEQLVREVECDIVLAAMVGAAGLPATLAAVELGRDVALANKETLVAAGALVIPAAVRSGSKLLPVDSEHCGVWQCLASMSGAEAQAGCVPPMVCGAEVAKVVLTASGGPFRTWDKDRIENATPREALNHPTWSMGPKVTIDSASLTNKALEVIEAHWLFGLEADRIGVLVHPQSVVHALVEYADGNVIAQLGPPDMRSPIQCALTWPRRAAGVSRKIDWAGLSRLEFSPPDLDRFPALEAGFEVVRRGGTAGAVFNAANEAAVQAFLAGHDIGPGGNGGPRLCEGLRAIRFGEIARLSRAAMEEVGVSALNSLDDALRADAEARRFVERRMAR